MVSALDGGKCTPGSWEMEPCWDKIVSIKLSNSSCFDCLQLTLMLDMNEKQNASDVYSGNLFHG